jgi:hypothetical protein
MSSIDDAVARAEAKEEIRERSRARLQAFLASKGNKPVVDSDPAVLAEEVPEVEPAPATTAPTPENEPLSPQAQEMLKAVEGQFNVMKDFAGELDAKDENFDEKISNVHPISSTTITLVFERIGLEEATIVQHKIKDFNIEISEILHRKEKEREAYLKSKEIVVPETEVFVPEVLEGAPEVKKNTKSTTEKPGAKTDPIDVEFRDITEEKEGIAAREWARDLRVENVDAGVVQNKSEADRRLEELSQRLDEARKDFVKQDREMDRGASIWKKITGFGKRLESGTLKEAFDEAKLGYENALKDYKDAILATEVEDKEDAKIVAEWLTKGEFLSLENERVDAKVREGEGWTDKIKNGYLGMVDRYRKLPATTKIAIGFGITATGFGIGLTGGTLLAGGLLTSRQFFSMSVSSVGFKSFLDGMAERKRRNDGEKEAENIVKSSSTERIGRLEADLLIQNLDQKIAELDAKLQKEKRNEKIRNWSAFVGGLVLSSVARYFGKEAVEHSGVKTILKNTGDKIMDTIGNQKSVMGIGYHAEAPAETVKVEDVISAKNLETLKVQVDKEILPPTSPVPVAETLTVAKGSSLEGTIINHLKAEGMSPEEAGKKAHVMALEYLADNQSVTEHHLIHPDAKITLDASGEHIANIDDSGTVATPLETPQEPVAVPDALESSPEITPEINSGLENLNGSISALYESNVFGEKFDEATYNSNKDKFIANIFAFLTGDKDNRVEAWWKMKDVPMKEVIDKNGKGFNKSLKIILDKMLDKDRVEIISDDDSAFRKEIRPRIKKGETVQQWVARFVALAEKYKLRKL